MTLLDVIALLYFAFALMFDLLFLRERSRLVIVLISAGLIVIALSAVIHGQVS